MKKTIIIGTGGIANRHANTLNNIEGAELVAGVDIRPDAAEAFATRHGIKAYTNLTVALDEETPDYVVITTPRQAREELIGICIDRGIPFIVEKPPSKDISSGKRMAGLIAERNPLHAVCFNHRYNPAVDFARNALRGKPITMVSVQTRTPLAHSKIWESRVYPFNVAQSGGLIGEVGIHYVDIARYLCGAEVDQVEAVGSRQVFPDFDGVDSIDAAAWVMRLTNGVVAAYAHTWCASDWFSCVTLTSERDFINVQLMGGKARAWGWVDGEDVAFEDEDDSEHHAMHVVFLKAVENGSMDGIRTPFADALETFRVCGKLNEKLYGATPELA